MELRVPTNREVKNILDEAHLSGECTDLAILTGAFVELYESPNGSFPQGYFNQGSYFVNQDDCIVGNYMYKAKEWNRFYAIRPLCVFDDAFRETYLAQSPETFLYGSYPQTVAPSTTQKLLETLYLANSLEMSSKTYTFDSRTTLESDCGYLPVCYPEYCYGNHKFIRIKANMHKMGSFLSDSAYYKSGSFVWVQVEPVEWLVSKDHNYMLSKKCLVAGVPLVSGVSSLRDYISRVLIYDLGFSSFGLSFSEEDLSKDVVYVMERLKQLRFHYPDMQSEVDAILERMICIEAKTNGQKTLKKV